jgi:hypothetical protein
MSTSRTIKGYVTALPVGKDERKARVAVEEDGVVYHVVPRGAGVDLDEYVSAFVEVRGVVHLDEDNTSFVNVRDYTLLEEEFWMEDK